MSSIYTPNQREAVKRLSIYDYMYRKLRPPVGYGTPFYIHTNHKCGEVTTASDPGGILISLERGYKNWITGYSVRDGAKGIPAAYALMDYYNTIGHGSYNIHDKRDCAYIIAEIAADIGIAQENSVNIPAKKPVTSPKPRTILDNYKAAVTAERQPVEIPAPAKYGNLGRSAAEEIIRYMSSRCINPQITRALMDAGLLYLSEGAPYYIAKKDESGNNITDHDGHLCYERDCDGNRIPQTYVDQLTGERRVTMQYNLVFVSKDQTRENAFFERKPLSKRGQAYIASKSSPAGYWGFTGHLPNFQQSDVPKNAGQNMRAYICEAPIDAISLYILHQKLGIIEPAEYIAISGVTKDMAIQRAICEGYDCVLAFDNDSSGKSHMDARRSHSFIDPITGKECSLPAIVPPKIEFDLEVYGRLEHRTTKDWNDVLLVLTKGCNYSSDPIDALLHGKSAISAPKPLIFRGLEKTVRTLRQEPVLPIPPRSQYNKEVI